MKTILAGLLLSILLSLSPGLAQVVITSPAYPTDSDSCTLIYDAAQGNGELKNVAPPLYAHTGVITNLSTAPSDWKYVVADWNVNIPKIQLTPLGNNLYQLKFKPSVRNYYGVPAAEVIKKMAFVFRNADGSKVGRNSDGSDIFVDIYPDELSVNLVLPSNRDLYLKQGTPISVRAVSPAATQMRLLVNGTEVKSVTGQELTDTLPADNFGADWTRHTVKVIATSGALSVADSFAYTIIPPSTVADLPAGLQDGINYPDSATAALVLYAPYKDHVFVIGDFNDWKPERDHYMNVTPDGNRYWLMIGGLTPGQEYIFQYLVDGTLRIGDPYADKVSDPDDQYITAATYPGLKAYPAGKTTGIATYLQPGQEPYAWNTTPFTPPPATDLVIYELLLRDFTAAHDFQSLIDTMDYLKSLGINAIELMPVMEFEGNLSWGYNPNFSFAVDKYYGQKNDLKRLVEEAHLRGMAIILDIVCNHHFGSSPLVRLYWDAANSRPAANSPWFNPVPKHPYNVGYDFNHETPFTRQYMRRLLSYWLEEFHVDGFRFDLSKGFTQKNSYPDDVSLWGQYDASRINILTDYVMALHAVNPNAYAIMEHFADNSEEQVLSSRNMLLWGNLNGNYNEATMGWNAGGKSDFSWISYVKRGWSDPHVVGYMESHDEERLSFKNIAYGNAAVSPWYNVKDTGTSLKRLELAANFFFTIPGPKMIWQFGELGYDYSINSNGGRLAPKPIRWDYLDDWRRAYTRNVFATLAAMKKELPVFETSDYSLDVGNAVKRLWLRHATMDVTVLGNFDVNRQQVLPSFTRTGWWYELYTGDSLNITDVNLPMSFEPGEYRLYTTNRLQKPWYAGIPDDLPGNGGLHARVWPNPACGEFTVEILADAVSDAYITISDPGGRILKELPAGRLTTGLNRVTATTEPLQPGLYLYSVTAGHRMTTGKLIVRP